MVTDQILHSDLAIPPGEYLEEVLSDLGMTKNDLAKRMGRPAAKLSSIFKGEKQITAETAVQLENAVGVPAHIWLGLESEYRLVLARQLQPEHSYGFQEESEFVKKFCYKQLVNAGEVIGHRRIEDKIAALKEYFGVMSLTSVTSLKLCTAAIHRIGNSGELSKEALAAWLRMGERRAQKRYCEPYDKSRLEVLIKELRGMTIRPPENFQSELREQLAECGVVLVICEHFPKTKAHGAVFWIGRDKVVLMITIRGAWADVFWFSLFHEIGHILLHDRHTIILEDDSINQIELEANAFAANALIPPKEYGKFMKGGKYFSVDVKSFAKKVGIHPGVVVGRLQHDGKIPHDWLNGLRERYQWDKSE